MSAEHGHGGHGAEPLLPQSEYMDKALETTRVVIHAGIDWFFDWLLPGTSSPGGGHGGGGHH